MRDQIFAGELDNLLNNISRVQHLIVLFDDLPLMVIEVGHGSLQETCCESCHVRDGTVDEELFYDLLVREDLAEPQCQADVVLESLSDDPDQEWDLCADACSKCYSQRERDDILEDFELIFTAVDSTSADSLQIGGSGRQVV